MLIVAFLVTRFLHNNKLQRIPSGAFKNMESLKRLRLDSNALVCDCEMVWLVKMLQAKQKTTQAAATCQYPIAMQGKSLASMSEHDFHCKKPKITEDPHDVEVTFGGTVFFNCKAEGDPVPDIVWMKNSNELNMGDPRYSKLADGTLMIQNTVDADVGVYECMAKSPAGEAKSRAAKMHYQKSKVRPHFRRTPLDQESEEGGTIRLYCAAIGQPQPEINWTRDDLPVTEDNRIQITPDNTLTITDIRREDSGIYKCTASSFVGRITAVAQVRVNVAPSFTTHPDNLTLKTGGLAELRCVADGSPPPAITWYKDGQPMTAGGRVTIAPGGHQMRVQHAKELDSGLYVCRAQNSVGFKETSAYITVTAGYFSPARVDIVSPTTRSPPPRVDTSQFSSREGRAPKIIIAPYDIEAPKGSTIEIPCKTDGEPKPTIVWTKDGLSVVVSKRHRTDAGIYECLAVNDNGQIRAQGELTVKDEIHVGPGDRFVRVAFEEARSAVDRAVNETLRKLFERDRGDKPASPSELFRLLRFPNAAARDVARAADVYERTLYNIRKHVEAGMKINLTKGTQKLEEIRDFSYKELLSSSHLELVANLSGCMVHRPFTNCSDMCFHSKYRAIDGTCNNLQHPMWGASLTGFRRILKPIYENGFSTPIGWKKTVKYYGFPKPSARLVSTSLISTTKITQDTHFTHMLMQWGQFLDHDLDHATPSVSSESWDGIDCKRSCDYAAPCFPMEVPPNDPRIKNRRCIDFIRSSSICGSGQTSVLFDTVMPREQINQLTSYIDASQVYGFAKEVAQDLREFRTNYGHLREGTKLPGGKPFLPLADAQPNDCRRDPTESEFGCFLAGDIRSNEQLGLLAMHTIWMREHNRVATQLRQINPHWDGDMLYHEARKVVGAQMQHITYKHWLPNILGDEGMLMIGPYEGYDPTVNPSIANVFATAALRFGHSLINPVLHRLNKTFQTIPEGDVPLHKAFFAPWRLIQEGGVDPLLRGLFTVPAKLKTPHENLNTELTEHLFQVAHAVALDLAAMNIQRGRDHGIPGYNDWRKYCNLSEAETFDDLRNEISSESVRNTLKELYGHPGDKLYQNSLRFWYENPSVFKPEQLTQIKQSTLSSILCNNGDDISDITHDVFVLPAEQPSRLVSCTEVRQMDLRFWTECCNDCSNSGEFNSITQLSSARSRRDLGFSYPSDKPQRSSLFYPDNTTIYHNLTSPTTTEKPETFNEVRADDNEIDEERIEGIESALEEFQKTIKQLRRKIRKLEHHCQVGGGTGGKQHGGKCLDVDGNWRKNDEVWKKDACTKCTCQEKQVTCTTTKCSAVQCTAPTLRTGKCCPECT
uniref:Peroxidase n=1 Tax=Timema douglasi TaxID=61478 RepID=A0A7R8ZB74_TIMDO|nr:unnamed protein product [Timema douglasi]